MISIRYDREADAAYIRLGEGKRARTEEESDVCIVDYDVSGQPLGIELLSVFGYAGASLHSLVRKGLLTMPEADAAINELRGELVAV